MYSMPFMHKISKRKCLPKWWKTENCKVVERDNRSKLDGLYLVLCTNSEEFKFLSGVGYTQN